MAAPTPTTRQTPTGAPLLDGYQTKITFARAPAFSVWEKDGQPPGVDGGDKIDITTMHNNRVTTSAPRSLYMMTDGQRKVAYDPIAYNTAKDTLVNENGVVTETFSDGSSLAYFGYLKSFIADNMVIGTQPEATMTICVTNYDPVNKVEAEPVMTLVSGT